MRKELIGLQQAEDYIRNQNLKEAIEILKKLAIKNAENGRIAFDLGTIALLQEEEEIAIKYFEKAMEKKYFAYDIYINMAEAQNRKGCLLVAENNYKEAIKRANDIEEKWMALTLYVTFCIHHHMYLKAEKIVEQLIKEYPNNYEGYHLFYLILLGRKQFLKAEKYLNQIENKFCKHPAFLIDELDILEIRGKTELILDKIENDNKILEKIPQYALRKKVKVLIKEKKCDQIVEIIEIMIKQFEDMDAMISLMLLNIMKQDYLQAGKVAALILKKEKNTIGVRFFLATYFQIFIYYMLTDKSPNGEIKEWMKNASKWCIKWLESIEMIDAPVQMTLERVLNDIR